MDACLITGVVALVVGFILGIAALKVRNDNGLNAREEIKEGFDEIREEIKKQLKK